jgi:nitroreductase/NAD-dependent dihydropyrimidine dehydrogenase PreA subunit
MPSVVVDQDRCAKDGICVNVCGLGLLELGEDGLPRSRKPERCIACGHCMAVCSHDALHLETVERGALVPIDPQLTPRAEQVEQVLRARRSIRVYRDAPVSRTDIQRIIDTANMAPSGVNQHPIRWTVLSGREKLRALSQHVIDWMHLAIEKEPQTAAFLNLASIVRNWPKHDPLRGAPHLVVAHGAKANPMTAGSGPIAMTYFELAAQANGVGTCWAGYLMMAARSYAPLLDALEIPEQNAVVGAMMFGYSKIRFRYVPARPAPEVNWVG